MREKPAVILYNTILYNYQCAYWPTVYTYLVPHRYRPIMHIPTYLRSDFHLHTKIPTFTELSTFLLMCSYLRLHSYLHMFTHAAHACTAT